MNKCKYLIAWHGECKKPTGSLYSDFCNEHKDSCKCGRPAASAIGDAGRFMCNSQLCDNRKRKH